MENQIDRDRLLADDALAQAFKHWLLAPEQLAALDRGTIADPGTVPGADARSPRRRSDWRRRRGNRISVW